MKKFLLGIFLCAIAFQGHAAEKTWDGSDSAVWSLALNWVGGVVPTTVTDTVKFVDNGAAAFYGVSLDGAFSTSGFAIDCAARPYTFAPAAAQKFTFLTSPVLTVSATTTAVQVISAGIVLTDTLTITQANEAGALTLSGIIESTGGITKAGAGTLILSGTNTYAGATIVSVGTVTTGSTDGLGAGGALTLSNLAIVNIGAGYTQTVGNLTGVAGNTLTIGAASTLSVAGTGTTEFAGIISGTGILAKTGSGTLTLSGTNIYSGGTAASLGTLITGVNNGLGTGALTLSSTGAVTIGAGFTQSVVGLTGALGNTLTLTGDLTVTAGGTIYAGQLTGAGALAKSGAGVLTLTNAGTGSDATGTTTVSGAGGVTTGAVANSLPTGVLTLADSATVIIGGTQSVGGLIGASGNFLTLTGDLTVAQDGTSAFPGTISGAGALIKSGTGTLTLSGANTGATGTTTVSAGRLATNTASALPTGALALTGTSIVDIGFNQGIGALSGLIGNTLTIGSGSTLTVTQATDSEFVGEITGAGNLAKAGAGTLTLSHVNALTGTTAVSAGALTTTAETALPTGNLTLTNAATVNIGGNQVVADLDGAVGNFLVIGTGSTLTVTEAGTTAFAGTLSGAGALVKAGAGTLTLSHINTATGTTTVNLGTLTTSAATALPTGALTLAGTSIVNIGGNQAVSTLTGAAGNAMTIGGGSTLTVTQAAAAAFAGDISGAGGLTKLGAEKLTLSGTNTYTGATTVTAGTLAVTGTLTGSAVGVTGTLKGTGTITGAVTINSGGTLAPGASIGTTTIVGVLAFADGATYEVECNTTACDLTIATSSTIAADAGAGGVTLAVQPTAGLVYKKNTTYTIVQTTGGVVGTFTTLTSSLASITPLATYDTNNAYLTLRNNTSLAALAASNFNASSVAACIDGTNATEGSDFALVNDALLNIANTGTLISALLQLQPSQLKALALSQETSSLFIRHALSNRLEDILKIPCQKDIPERKWTIWGNVGGDYAIQHGIHREYGFNNTIGSALIGADCVKGSFSGGVAGAYSYNYLKWKDSAGHGNVQSGYGLFYGSWNKDKFFISGSLMGAYNHYEAHRNINFTDDSGYVVDRTAKSNFSGGEGGVHLKFGGLFNPKNAEVSPFLAGDYYYLHQNKFKEKGADTLNLKVKQSSYQLLRGEGGLRAAKCYVKKSCTWIPEIKISGIYEYRYGRNYTANFINNSCHFNVHGMNPHRALVAPGVGFTAKCNNNKLTISLKYDGEFGKDFINNMMNLMIGHSF